jgi:hypothetical protein
MRASGTTRRPRRLHGLILAAAFAGASPSLAAPQPAQLSPTFKDRDAPNRAPREGEPVCAVRFAEIVDARRSPDVLGVIGRRAVYAPKDFQAWMEAVLGGLAARGVTVRHDSDASAAPGIPSVRFTLQIASIQSTVVTYSASVVVKLQAEGGAGTPLDRSYRGRVARTAYWSGGTDTLQSAVDGAFADALDEMAVDLKALCAA